jgi:1,2-diacylglycerol 3-alpha-glucosyltransferase
MRVILATESYFPHVSGVTVSVHTLAKSLRARGHSVAIFAPSATGLGRVEHKDGIQVYRFPSVPNPFKPRTRIALRFFSPLVAETLDDFKPDIVHVHGPTGVPAAVAAAARKVFIPVVATQHFQVNFILAYLSFFGLAETLTRGALVAYLNSFYQKCDKLTVPSESLRRIMHEEGIKKRIEVISNGVNLQVFKAPEKSWKRHLPSDREIILHVGRIDHEKNIPVILEAMALVVAERPRALLVIGGTGRALRGAKKWVAEHRMQDYVRFLGKIPHGSSVLNELYHEASLFITACNIETQGIVVLEAMASGLPVVASKSGALPELVRHGETGYTALPNHPEEFARWVLAVLADPVLAASMGQAARLAVKRHDLNVVTDQVEELYQSLLVSL